MSKTMTDATMGSMEVEYETTFGLSIDTMTFGLGCLELSKFKVIKITRSPCGVDWHHRP